MERRSLLCVSITIFDLTKNTEADQQLLRRAGEMLNGFVMVGGIQRRRCRT